MVDKKDSFDDEFDFDDDFPSFDDDTDSEAENYQFDDEDEEGGAFDFSDSSDEKTPHKDESTALNDDTYEFEDIDDADNDNEDEAPHKTANFVMKQFSSSSTTSVKHVSTTHQKALPSNDSATSAVSEMTSANTLPDIGNNVSNASSDTSSDTLPAPVSTQQSVNLPMGGQQTAQLDEQTQKTISALVAQNKQLAQTVHDMQMALTRAGDKYNNLAQQIQSSDARITNMERSIAQVEGQMSKVDNALQAIVSAATATSEPSSMTSNYASNTNSYGGVRTTYQAPKQSDSANVYYIQAIIPGRAWIRTSNGQTITVAYGDELAGLGKVTKIDAENGVVITSSGAKVMYGINEG